MSLTSNLKEQGSAYQFLKSYLDKDICSQIIHNHNNLLSSSEIIQPPHQPNYPYALVGVAFSYAFRDWMYPLYSMKESLPCYTAAQVLGLEKKFNQVLKRSGNEKYFLMAYLEQYRRSGRLEINLGSLHQLQLPGDSYLRDALEDLNTLVEYIPHGWVGKERLLGTKEIYSNPTFDGSALVGGADAQMIMSNCLLDIRTTSKRSPFTIENLYQQCAYAGLDFQNRYKLNHLIWYYSRHQAVFSYPIEKLIPNLSEFRQEFKQHLSRTTSASYGLSIRQSAASKLTI